MRLAELVDLEWLLRDGVPVDAPRARARNAARDALQRADVKPSSARARVAGDPALRGALIRGWIEIERSVRGDALPGRRVAAAQRLVGWLLIAAGLMVGWGASAALLAYDGSVPVNVLLFSGVLFVGQILLLLILVWFVLSSGGHRVREPGVLQRLIQWLIGKALGKRGRDALAILNNARSRHAGYAEVERWLAFTLTQRFGIAFNLGALAGCLFQVVFSDLVFCWSTTLEVEVEDIVVLVRWLSAPWSWLGDWWVPDPEMVRHSQWVRMQGAFVDGGNLDEAIPIVARWWRFLVAGLAVYGLLPRASAWVFGQWRLRCASRRVAGEHVGISQVLDAVLPTATGWDAPEPDQVSGPVPGAGGGEVGHAPSAAPGAVAMAVVWGRVGETGTPLIEFLQHRFGIRIPESHHAGGASLDDDQAALLAIARLRPTRVLFVCEAGQQPTKDVIGFLREVRGALGRAQPLLIVMLDSTDGRFIDADAVERGAWRQVLGELRDTHLWVETIGANS